MPVIPCRESNPCIDPSVPVTNFSAEAPDPNTFISLVWPITNPDNPVGGDPGTNQPPNTWNADGCQSECVSTVSQQAADLCAAAQAALCAGGGPDKQNKQFLNSRQECDTICPDGSPFAYFVDAGLFVGGTKQAADAQAAAFACKAAAQFVFCLSDITTEVCVNSAYDSIITVSQGNPPFTFSLVSGGLPQGMALSIVSNRQLRISGVCTAPGASNFAIKAVDKFGNFMVRNYSICVVDIDQSSLPPATIGTAYTTTLTATFCANQTQSFQVVSGSLPPGLTLDEQTGVISGTPTGPAGNVQFRVRFQDAAS